MGEYSFFDLIVRGRDKLLISAQDNLDTQMYDTSGEYAETMLYYNGTLNYRFNYLQYVKFVVHCMDTYSVD